MRRVPIALCRVNDDDDDDDVLLLRDHGVAV